MWMMTDDMMLLREYARGNSEEAFAALVSRHVDLVYSVSLRQVGDPHLAEEITQAVFIILARKAESLGPRTILPAWLCRTARYTSANALTIQRRRQHREQEACMQSVLNEPEPESDVWNQIAPFLESALAQLGQKDQEAIVLRFFNGKSFKEVGAALGASEDTAKKRVNRTLEKMRRFFAKRGIVASATVLAGAISANSVHAAPSALTQAAAAAAFSKGATVSGSTLILVNHTWKCMAWAKTKIAIIAGVAILSGGAAIVAVESVVAPRTGAGPDLQGAWEGDANLGIRGIKRSETAHCRVVLRFSKTNDVYSAAADAIDLGVKDVRVSHVVYDFPAVRLDLGGWVNAEATLNARATEMTLRLGTNCVILERTNAPDSVPELLEAEDFAPRGGSDLQGYWKGEINQVPPFNLKIAGQSDGGFRGELEIPSLGAPHIPVTVTENQTWVIVKARSGLIMFQGRVDDTGTRIDGGAFFNGLAMPIAFQRAKYKGEPPIAESSYSFQSNTDLQGHWHTAVDVNLLQLLTKGRLKKFPLDLDIARLPDGAFSAALAMPLGSLVGLSAPIPASRFEHPLPNLRVLWDDWHLSFDGKLTDGKLVGKWKRGDLSFTLTFERSQP